MKLLLYVLVMLIFTPVLLLGLPFYMVPILLKRGVVSGTAYEPFSARVIYHLLGTRPDSAALTLTGGLPATNWVVMTLMYKPILLASKISGYVPSMLTYPPQRPIAMTAMMGARCEFFDAALLEHAVPGDQVVILGAGFDTRAYGILKDRELKLFEVDAPATQGVKRRSIERTGLDASAITFVSCDFSNQSWIEALKTEGFDTAQRTFVLWEGVTMYLDEEAIQSTLEAVASLAPGSRLACDFFSREWPHETLKGKLVKMAVKATYGESFVFGFPITPEF